MPPKDPSNVRARARGRRVELVLRQAGTNETRLQAPLRVHWRGTSGWTLQAQTAPGGVVSGEPAVRVRIAEVVALDLVGPSIAVATHRVRRQAPLSRSER